MMYRCFVAVLFTMFTAVSPKPLLAETRIMAVGDSITRGAEAYSFPVESYPESAYRAVDGTIPNDLRSYREHLHDLLTNTSCDASVTWVGSGSHIGRYPENHEGHGGWRADQILGEISTWLVQFKPDMVLLNIGTNDLLQGQSTVSTIADITGILNAIDEYEYISQNTVPVFLGDVIPILGWHATRDIRGNLNETELQRRVITGQIANLVSSRQSEGDNITVVDVNTDFFVDQNNVTNCATGDIGNPDNMMMTRCQVHLPPNSPDGIHPGLRGDRFLAQQFSDALQKKTDICGDNALNANLSPTTSISQPVGHDVTLPSNLILLGSATDVGGGGIRDVLIYIRNRDQKTWHSIAVPAMLSNSIGSSVNWSYSTSLPTGNYAVFVKARDNAGNASSNYSRRFTVADVEQTPSATISTPSAHYLTFPIDVTFTGTAADRGGSGLKDVLVYIKDRDLNSWHIVADPAALQFSLDSGVSWSYSVSLPPGNYAVFVKARDNAGNRSERLGRRFTISSED